MGCLTHIPDKPPKAHTVASEGSVRPWATLQRCLEVDDHRDGLNSNSHLHKSRRTRALAGVPLVGGPLAGRWLLDLSLFTKCPGYPDTTLGRAHTSSVTPGSALWVRDPHDPETGHGRLPRKLGAFSGSKVLSHWVSLPGALTLLKLTDK